MINGIFIKTHRVGGITVIIGSLCIGVSLLFGFLRDAFSELFVAGIVMGIGLCLEGLILVFFNRYAELLVEGGRITGRFHWFGKLDLALSEISFVRAERNTLTIYLNEKERYTVMGLSNAYAVAAVIRAQIKAEVREKAQALIERYQRLRKAQKKEIYAVFALVALMFILVFVTVFLTEAKDLDEFVRFDWICFCAMCVSELVVIVLGFVFALKCGKKTIPIAHLQFMARKAVTLQTPPGENAVRVYAEPDYCYRLVVFRHPDDHEVFFVVQALTPEFLFVWVNSSDVYESLDVLDINYEFWQDITDYFQ